MSRNNLNYLREDQFSELAKNGSAQDDYGITHDYAEGDLYVTEDGTGGTGGLYKHEIEFNAFGFGNCVAIVYSTKSTAYTSFSDLEALGRLPIVGVSGLSANTITPVNGWVQFDSNDTSSYLIILANVDGSYNINLTANYATGRPTSHATFVTDTVIKL